jgi:hypothetical protein
VGVGEGVAALVDQLHKRSPVLTGHRGNRKPTSHRCGGVAGKSIRGVLRDEGSRRLRVGRARCAGEQGAFHSAAVLLIRGVAVCVRK